MTNRFCQWKSMVAGGYHPDGHPEAERSGVEGSPVVIKSPLKGIGYGEREIPPLRSG
ncbi:hypothetical protein [Ravibacter arvi]|uniref:hypothetical protein n=1 Tax=Ravibacter arvi TaxID=2051041 RepID=UPI0031E8BFCE